MTCMYLAKVPTGSLVRQSASLKWPSPCLPWLKLSRHAPQPRSTGFVCTSLRQYASQVVLRPYQEECIATVLAHLSNGERRVGISLATGSGKTVIFSHLIDRLPPSTNQATQTLVIAHRQELVEQAADHCRRLYPEKTVEIEMADQNASGSADITVASVQTLFRESRLSKFDPSRFKLLLVDEVHHVVADSYMKILEHFNLAEKGGTGNTALVGVTATFGRLDGLALGSAIDQIVYHKDYVEMIKEGWLADAAFTTVQTSVDLSRVRTSPNRGDFQTEALSRAFNTEATNELTVRVWIEKAKERHSTLVFCVSVAHVKDLTAMYRQHGIDARFVISDTPRAERDRTLAKFKEGAFPVLINCGIFTEGTDIPKVDCIVLARPTNSVNLLIQMIGRGLRLCPGKTNCHVIDMIASRKSGIMTTPTLFGLNPSELVEERTVQEMKQLYKAKETREDLETLQQARHVLQQLRGEVVLTDYENVDDYMRDSSQRESIHNESRLGWVIIYDGKYVLTDHSGSYLIINKDATAGDGAAYQVSHYARLRDAPGKKSPYMRPRKIAVAKTLKDALHAADTFAVKRFTYSAIVRSALWRKAPPSDNQLEVLKKRLGDHFEPLSQGLTKGAAHDCITRLKHGTKGHIEAFARMRRKQAAG